MASVYRHPHHASRQGKPDSFNTASNRSNPAKRGNHKAALRAKIRKYNFPYKNITSLTPSPHPGICPTHIHPQYRYLLDLLYLTRPRKDFGKGKDLPISMVQWRKSNPLKLLLLNWCPNCGRLVSSALQWRINCMKHLRGSFNEINLTELYTTQGGDWAEAVAFSFSSVPLSKAKLLIEVMGSEARSKISFFVVAAHLKGCRKLIEELNPLFSWTELCLMAYNSDQIKLASFLFEKLSTYDKLCLLNSVPPQHSHLVMQSLFKEYRAGKSEILLEACYIGLPLVVTSLLMVWKGMPNRSLSDLQLALLKTAKEIPEKPRTVTDDSTRISHRDVMSLLITELDSLDSEAELPEVNDVINELGKKYCYDMVEELIKHPRTVYTIHKILKGLGKLILRRYIPIDVLEGDPSFEQLRAENPASIPDYQVEGKIESLVTLLLERHPEESFDWILMYSIQVCNIPLMIQLATARSYVEDTWYLCLTVEPQAPVETYFTLTKAILDTVRNFVPIPSQVLIARALRACQDDSPGSFLASLSAPEMPNTTLIDPFILTALEHDSYLVLRKICQLYSESNARKWLPDLTLMAIRSSTSVRVVKLFLDSLVVSYMSPDGETKSLFAERKGSPPETKEREQKAEKEGEKEELEKKEERLEKLNEKPPQKQEEEKQAIKAKVWYSQAETDKLSPYLSFQLILSGILRRGLTDLRTEILGKILNCKALTITPNHRRVLSAWIARLRRFDHPEMRELLSSHDLLSSKPTSSRFVSDTAELSQIHPHLNQEPSLFDHLTSFPTSSPAQPTLSNIKRYSIELYEFEIPLEIIIKEIVPLLSTKDILSLRLAARSWSWLLSWYLGNTYLSSLRYPTKWNPTFDKLPINRSVDVINLGLRYPLSDMVSIDKKRMLKLFDMGESFLKLFDIGLDPEIINTWKQILELNSHIDFVVKHSAPPSLNLSHCNFPIYNWDHKITSTLTRLVGPARGYDWRLPSIEKCCNLTYLDLSFTTATESSLSELTSLTTLIAIGTALPNHILSSLTNLQQLDVSHSYQISKYSLTHLPALTWLSATGVSRFKDKHVSVLKQLTYLAPSLDLTEQGINSLPKLRKLELTPGWYHPEVQLEKLTHLEMLILKE